MSENKEKIIEQTTVTYQLCRRSNKIKSRQNKVFPILIQRIPSDEVLGNFLENRQNHR